MADKEYKGPERREQHWLGGATARDTRRSRETRGRGLGKLGHMMSGTVTQTTRNESPTARMGAHGIVEIKEDYAPIERRIGGAGRRSDDLARALDTGEPVIYQVGKGALKSTGKLAKKAAKHVPAIGAAVGIYDLVNRTKK